MSEGPAKERLLRYLIEKDKKQLRERLRERLRKRMKEKQPRKIIPFRQKGTKEP